MFENIGWGTWIRTKIDGVRVRCSTVELSPSKPLITLVKSGDRRHRMAESIAKMGCEINCPSADCAAAGG